MLQSGTGDGDIWVVVRSEGFHLCVDHPLELDAGGRDVAGAAAGIGQRTEGGKRHRMVGSVNAHPVVDQLTVVRYGRGQDS